MIPAKSVLRPLALALALAPTLGAGCRHVPHPAMPSPCPRPWNLEVEARLLLDRVEHGSEEERHHAVRGLARHPFPVMRRRLRRLLDHEHALTRNAAARTLVEIGEPYAARALIANLHRDERTYVVTDAIHHLAALFGTTRGYEPNLGYRHQTEAQERWWTWWEAGGRSRSGTKPEDDQHAAVRRALAASLEAYDRATFDTPEEAWAAAAALWQEAAPLAPSRYPPDVAGVADVFAALAERYPDHASIQNNHALSALNDGRWKEADAAYGNAIALEPDDAQLRNDHGILLEGLGRLAEAEAAYQKATELRPDDDGPWSHLGDALAKRGRPAEATEAYREAERLAPEKWHYHRLWIARLPAAPACHASPTSRRIGAWTETAPPTGR